MIVMQLWGKADGTRLPKDGWYLLDFDFEAHGGQGEAAMTKDIAEAKRFADMAEAISFYRTVPEKFPVRRDGMPNRPMTGTNWLFEHVTDEEETDVHDG